MQATENLLYLLCIGILWSHTQARPIPDSLQVSSRQATDSQSSSSRILNVSDATARGFLWSSIGLAVLTALLQGLVTALALMTESSNQWTFRFRLAKIEHWWWTTVSGLLLISLVLILLSFATGNGSESISVLVLSSTTFLTIVRYMLPSWRARNFIYNRWLAWSGPSRTAVKIAEMTYCGTLDDWRKLSKVTVIAKGKSVPSDYYGWHLFPLKGISQDPTDILKDVNTTVLRSGTLSRTIDYIYNERYEDLDTVSLLWGAETQGFQPRVSRSVSAMTSSLLRSQPFTTEGYAGEGFCLAMGILGRNKGLKPGQLVFKMTRQISSSLEQKSTWRPRPSKTLRSYYWKTLDAQYHGLGEEYVDAAVELSLILMDAYEPAIATWLQAGCEHQSFEINKTLQVLKATPDELRAHYESSYISMIISLNNMRDKQLGRKNHEVAQAKRPDIICLALRLKALGVENPPSWWNSPEIEGYLNGERQHLDHDWYQDAAKLLGLAAYPEGLENGHWNGTPHPDQPNGSLSGLSDPTTIAAVPSQSLIAVEDPITGDVELREFTLPQNDGNSQEKITGVKSTEQGRVVSGSE